MIKRIKRIGLILGFISCNACYGQWFPVNQDTTFYNASIFFLNADTGFVVGDNNTGSLFSGVISRTLDGGVSWDTTNTYNYVPSVFFPSKNAGYYGGSDGEVYKTTDVGNSWNYIGATIILDDYSNCYFFNNDTGFVSDGQGAIIKTNDGGLSWNLDTILGGFCYFWCSEGSIRFVNDFSGIVALGEDGIYARTNDGGITWQTGSIDSNMNVFSIYMRNLNVGYAVGRGGKISRTFDGGQSWTTPIVISQYNLNDITFFTDSVGYIVGGKGECRYPTQNPPYKGVIWKTIDGGNSWQVEDSTYDDELTSIFVVNNSIGYAAGNSGRILKITNGNAVGLQKSKIKTSDFQIFPNPTTGTIQLTFNTKHNAPMKCEIINVMGEKVFSSPAPLTPKGESTRMEIDVSYLAKGIYVVWMGDGKSWENKKLVVE